MVVKKTLQEFKDFVTTGNLIAIAIGLLVGLQVSGLVGSFTENLFNPIFSMIVGEGSLDTVAVLTINDSQFKFGAFFGDVINFAAVMFVAFLVVKAATKIFPPKPAGPSEVDILIEIRDSLKK